MKPIKKQARFWRTVPMALLAFTLALTFLAGCGASSYEATDTAQSAPAAMPAVPPPDNYATDGAAEDAMPGVPGDATPPTLTLPPDERKIILTANLTVETLDFDKSCTDLQQAVQQAGGYISHTDMGGQKEHYSRYANFTFKVPAEKYSDFIAAAEGAGTMLSRNENSEDVTSQMMDIDSRLSSLRAQETRLMELMQTAADLEDLLVVQQQLTEVQYEIEGYLAMQRSYENLVAYSTVNLYLQEVREVSEVVPEPLTYGEKVQATFAESWANMVRGFQNFGLMVVYAVPVLLPLLAVGLIALIIVLIVRASIRRGRNKRAALAAAPAAPSAPPADGTGAMK